MIFYSIVRGHSTADLVIKVNAYLQMGWVPQGGPFFIVSEVSNRYGQAVVWTGEGEPNTPH